MSLGIFLGEYVFEKEEYISLENRNWQLIYALIPEKGEKYLRLEMCYRSICVAPCFLPRAKLSLQGHTAFQCKLGAHTAACH